MSRLIIEDKNLELLRNGQLSHADMQDYASLTIFIKDMTKPVFTPEDVMFLLEHFNKENLAMIPVATRDEMMFNIGGNVYSGEPCTLVQMDIQIPDIFAEKVRLVSAKAAKPPRKSTGTRKRAGKTVEKVEQPVSTEPVAKEPMIEVRPKESHDVETEPSGL